MRPLILPLALTVALAGCSLLLHFDPEGQPCDSQGACLAGFRCLEGVCRATDGGTGCVAPECTVSGCENRVCAPGYHCVVSGAFGSCQRVLEPDLGHPCFQDIDCSRISPGRRCYRGAIPSGSGTGARRAGICVEGCVEDGGCETPGASCQRLNAENFTQLCMPPGSLTGCGSDGDCRDAGLVCTVYDHVELGPSTLCDAPVASGKKPGAACVTANADGGDYCASGLCFSVATASKCREPCGNGCSTAEVCAPVEVSLTATPRHVPMCLPAVSHCSPCSGSAQCGADAPHCVSFDSRAVCFAACVPDAGGAPSCPGGRSCGFTGGGYYCVPATGDGGC